MTIYPELNGISLITNATDRENDAITVYRINGSIVTWAGLETVAIVAGELTAYVSENGTVTVEPTDNDSSPADAATTLYGSFTYTLWDGQDEGPTRTCNISLKGTAGGGGGGFVATGAVFDLNPDAGVTGSSPVTAWVDQIGSKAMTVVGSPTLGTPPGGTATNTMVIGSEAGFSCADLTNFPISGADRTAMILWKPTGGFGYAGFGYGSGLAGRAFTPSVDGNGELALDTYSGRTLLGVNALNQWNVTFARLSAGVLTVYVGAAKVYEAAASLNTGADLINVCLTFSTHTTLAEIGRIRLYGRALTDAEILSDVAAANALCIGDTAVTAPGTPAASNISSNSFTVGGTVGESYGYVLWAVKAGTGTMTEPEIIAGTGALQYGVAPVSNASSWSASVIGADESSNYRCHAVFYDLVGGKSSVVSSATITTTGTDVTAPALAFTATFPKANGTTAIDVSFTVDEAATWIVGAFPDTATEPNDAQVVAGTDGDGNPLRDLNTGFAAAAGTVTDAITTLTPGTGYKIVVRAEDPASNASLLISGSVTTASSPGTVAETVDGLFNGATPVGRTSTNTLKTVGQLPTGASVSGGKIIFTADNVLLEDFDFSGYRIDFNNRQGCTVRQSIVQISNSHSNAVEVPIGSHNSTLDFCDILGFYGPSNDKQLILHQASANSATATCALNLLINRCVIKGMMNDGVHLVGGGSTLRECFIGLPWQHGSDITVYSGVPGDYTTGDCVMINVGNGQWPVRVCQTATPTLDPDPNNANADWAKTSPHVDMVNPRAAIGAGVTIERCYFRDYKLGADGVRTYSVNNIIRLVRNSGDIKPYNTVNIDDCRSDRGGIYGSYPIQVGSGTNFVGPLNFRRNRIGLNFNGNYYSGSTSTLGVWDSNTDEAGNPLAQP